MDKILNRLQTKMGTNLRDYQIDAIKQMNSNKKGKIIHATGTGKSYTFGFYLAHQVNQKPGHRVYVVLAHRIDLCHQLLEDIYKINVKNDIDCGYTVLTSGLFKTTKLDLYRDEVKSKVKHTSINSTTSSVQLQKDLDDSKSINRCHIIVGTYHSAERLCNVKSKFDTVICDEAHEMVSEGRHQFATCFKPKKIFFFTATEKHTSSDSSFGMNNETLFGKLIHEFNSQKAVKRGILVKPRIIEINSTGDHCDDDVIDIGGRIIKESYDKIKSQGITPKLLVTAKGTKHIKTIMASKEIQELIDLGVQVFDLSSDLGRNLNNNIFKGNRKKYMEKIKEVANTDTGLIFIQIQMANTGINIPQLNSMITFRGLGIITGQQTYGRISRQLKDKEWAWVLIPNISLENKDTKEQLKLFISYLRSLNNNYDPVQQYNEDKFQGLGEEEEPEGLNNSKKNKKQKRSPLDELIFEIENEEIAKLELSELISGLGELMKESDFII